MIDSASTTRLEEYLREFERWVIAKQRRELRAELEAHLREAAAAGRLEEAIAGLGRPRDAAKSFGGTTALPVASRLRRIVGAAVDYGTLIVLLTGYGAYLVATSPLDSGEVGEPKFCIPFMGCAASDWIGNMLAVVLLLYFAVGLTLLEFRYGRTPGKVVARTRVVSEDGTSIDLGQAIIRRLPLVFSGVLQIVDWAFALFGPKYQRAFDRIARTMVILDR